MSGRHNGVQAIVKPECKYAAFYFMLQSQPLSGCWQQRWLYQVSPFCQWTICIPVSLKVNISLAATKESLHTDAQGFAWNPMVWTCRCGQSAGRRVEDLDELAADKEQKADTINQAEGFLRWMDELETAVMATAWNDILGRLNSTSISLQDPTVSLHICQLAWWRHWSTRFSLHGTDLTCMRRWRPKRFNTANTGLSTVEAVSESECLMKSCI